MSDNPVPLLFPTEAGGAGKPLSTSQPNQVIMVGGRLVSKLWKVAELVIRKLP